MLTPGTTLGPYQITSSLGAGPSTRGQDVPC
jgi:hypothetical protein